MKPFSEGAPGSLGKDIQKADSDIEIPRHKVF